MKIKIRKHWGRNEKGVWHIPILWVAFNKKADIAITILGYTISIDTNK